MRRRLLASTALIALAAVLLLGVPLGVVGGLLVRAQTTEALERQADVAGSQVGAARAAGRPVDAQLLTRLAPREHALRLTSPLGAVVVGGSDVGEEPRVTSAGRLERAGRLDLLAPADEGDSGVRAFWLAVVGLSLLAVLVALGLAFAQGRRLAGPLERLAARASRVGVGGTDERVASDAGPELAALESALEEADRRIADLLRREREFSANASHQLRAPLTGLRLRLEEALALARDDTSRAEIIAAVEQADRLVATIEQVEALARARESDRPARSDLGPVAGRHAETAWAPRLAAAGRRLEVEVPPGLALPVGLGAEGVRQVVDVLLDNALAPGAGDVLIEVGASRGRAILAVEDQGEVPAALAGSVLERRVSGSGSSGVGLSFARELLQDAGGDLRLVRAGGSRFEASLPLAAATPAATGGEEPAAAVPTPS